MYTHGTSTGKRLRTLAICRLEISLNKLQLVYYPRCHTQKFFARDHWPSMYETLRDCAAWLSVTNYKSRNLQPSSCFNIQHTTVLDKRRDQPGPFFAAS